MNEALIYVYGLLIGVLGFFLKREIDKNDKNQQRIDLLEKDVMLHKEKLTNHIEMITSSLTKMELNMADMKKDIDQITLYVYEARHEIKSANHEKTILTSMLKEINEKLK